MCLRDCFALGLALIVSDDSPTSPPVTFGLFNFEGLPNTVRYSIWKIAEDRLVMGQEIFKGMLVE